MRYSVKAASRVTGITESRLRTWERRYGIPCPDRSDTGRRQYDDADIAVIRRMAALVDAGLSASDAAAAAQMSAAGDMPAVTSAPPVEAPRVAAMVEAARRFDEAALVDAIEGARDELGWDEALETVVLPAMKRVGYAWMDASASVATEHFASQVVRQELCAAISLLPLPDGDGPAIILACPEAEEHDLALLALAFILRRAGQRVIYLGANVPAVDLANAAEATRAGAICLAATTEAGFASLVRTTRSILSARGPRLFIGGPAVAQTELAAGVRLPAYLADAAALIIRSLSD